MGKLTKELLLQYALHSNKEIKKAYQLRLCEELLKKGLVTIEDIPFDFTKGINPNDFFVLLTNQALNYCETSQVWDTYFEIVSKTKVAQIFVAYGMIKLCNSHINSSVKERGYQWLRELPETNWEGRLIECLFGDDPFNHKLAKIGLERCKKTSESFAMEYGVEYIPSYPVRLSLIKILAAKKQQKVSAFLLTYCLKKLNPELSDSENKKGAEFLPKALNLLAYIANSMTSSEGITEENCCLLSKLYISGKIDTDTYLKISAKLTMLADKKNNSYAYYLSDGLGKAARESVEYLPLVEKIMRKQLAVLENKEQIRKILDSLSVIAWHYKGREDFVTEILPPLKKLFLSRVSVVQGASSALYRHLYYSWAEMDKEVFLKIAAHALENEACELMRFVAAQYPQLWDKFFAKLKFSEQMASTIIYHLINIYSDEKCAAVHEKASSEIKSLLKKFKFSEFLVETLSDKLQTVEEFKSLQVRSSELSAQEVNDILNLLNQE